MKFFLCLVLISMAAWVLCDNIDKDAQIQSLVNEAADPEGNFHYAFETSNGIQAQEAGNAQGATGSFNYISPEGEHISLSYTADEEGYHPVGDHLPTSPPIPAEILRSLEYIRAHPPANYQEKK
ncbi:pupal cuticle protein Edg-78E [Musca domestica]|uniref:Pupal cuticle protein Edg-78E n=1 Tax=Musca domestica TaxID=7370 RepID=A0A9J7I5H2_MUSDO|nr:pupal cuticle protein Edg-78E [Musca domestica]